MGWRVTQSQCEHDLEQLPLFILPLTFFLSLKAVRSHLRCLVLSLMLDSVFPARQEVHKGGDFLSCVLIYSECFKHCLAHSRCLWRWGHTTVASLMESHQQVDWGLSG